jgi:hypothetical protein
MKYLYHGSTTQNIKILEPRKRYTPQGKIDYFAIYATPLPAYAAAHSFPWSTDEGVGLDVDQSGVNLSIPISLKERLQIPVSIYKVSSDNFRHTKEELTGYTWHTINPVEVIEEIKYPSVEIALRELGAKFQYI